MRKRKIKWYNIIYLLFNIYAAILTLITLKHIQIINRTEMGKIRLTVITIIMYGMMYFGSMLIRKLYIDRKGKNK